MNNVYTHGEKLIYLLTNFVGYIEDKEKELQHCCQSLFETLSKFFMESDCNIKELHLINKNPNITKTLVDIFNCNSSKPTANHDAESDVQNLKVQSNHTGSKYEEESRKPYQKQFERQHSWSSPSQETTKSPYVDYRGTGARPKSNPRSQSLYVKKTNTETARFLETIGCGSKKDDSDKWQTNKKHSANENAEEGANFSESEKKSGNLLIIGDDDSVFDDLDHSKFKDDKETQDENCAICLDVLKNKKRLVCGHEFCEVCLTHSFTKHKKACPICGKILGEVTGSQPDGKMMVEREFMSLPGFEDCGTIVVKYKFPSGIQGVLKNNYS